MSIGLICGERLTRVFSEHWRTAEAVDAGTAAKLAQGELFGTHDFSREDKRGQPRRGDERADDVRE
jgi:hypothetical protein